LVGVRFRLCFFLFIFILVGLKSAYILNLSSPDLQELLVGAGLRLSLTKNESLNKTGVGTHVFRLVHALIGLPFFWLPNFVPFITFVFINLPINASFN
jgi:hypothetical protein